MKQKIAYLKNLADFQLKKNGHKALVAVGALAASSIATAATAPTASATIGYTIYDLVFNQFYGSGGGYLAGALMLFWAFTKIKSEWREAAFIGIGGTGVLALPAIATALGAVVY